MRLRVAGFGSDLLWCAVLLILGGLGGLYASRHASPSALSLDVDGVTIGMTKQQAQAVLGAAFCIEDRGKRWVYGGGMTPDADSSTVEFDDRDRVLRVTGKILRSQGSIIGAVHHTAVLPDALGEPVRMSEDLGETESFYRSGNVWVECVISEGALQSVSIISGEVPLETLKSRYRAIY